MEELKQEATELGLDFKGNISKVELQAMVDAEKQIANDSTETEYVIPEQTPRIKVIINPRDSGEIEGFVKLNKYQAQFKFDEEIELPSGIVDFLKTKGGYVYDAKGNKKWQSRWIIEKV